MAISVMVISARAVSIVVSVVFLDETIDVGVV